MTVLAPPFSYYGGKTRLAPSIIDLLPSHQHYVEPFAGSLAVLLAKPRSAMETVNDLDGDLMTFWRVLRERPGDLHEQMRLTPHSRAEQILAFAPSNDVPDLERARRVWVRLTQGRGRTTLQRGQGWRFYRDPAGSSTAMPDVLAGLAGRVPACAQRLHGVSLEQRTALEVIEDYGQAREALLYVDPPYLAQVRTAGRYQHELSTVQEHRDLSGVLNQCRSTVVLSGYASPLYDDELYPGWYRTELPATTTNGAGISARTEVLWANRPLSPNGGLW